MVDSSHDSTSLIADRELITQLELASQGLLWVSEAEYPIEVIYWQGIENFDEQYLLQRQDPAGEVKISVLTFEDFFASVTRLESWHNETEQQEVRRYQALADLLASQLTDLQVYLLGEIEINVYVLGKTQEQAIAGIKTKIVRT